MEWTYLTFTLVSAVISALLISFGAFLLGLWCGWMRWGRRPDPRREMSENRAQAEAL